MSLPSAASSPAPALRVEYVDAPLAHALATPGLLAVFGFGDAAPTQHPDPRYRHIALPALGRPPLECWWVEDAVHCGHDAGIAWSRAGTLSFGALELPDHGDAEATTATAYARLQRWLADSPHPHLLRVWNYLDAITAGDGDAERYRRFCVGRARGIGRPQAPGELPAATAIGHPQPTGRMLVYWLAASTPGTPLENPRQVQAWRYPRQYGPQPPGFARALLPPSPAMPLLISGTAAVVGHASHGESLREQLNEILTNLRSLLAAARALRPTLPATPGPGSRLKVYVRDAEAMPTVDAWLQAHLPDVPRIVLHGHVCRRELQVEIDGCHG